MNAAPRFPGIMVPVLERLFQPFERPQAPSVNIL